MKLFSTLMLLLTLSLSSAFAEEKDKKNMTSEQMEMMKKMHESAMPTDAHKILSQMEGKWTTTSKFWESADGKPQESKGESAMKMILGGRYLQQEATGKAMGMDYSGFGLTGYDTVKKRYDSVWTDNMSTGMMISKGEYDPKTKTITEKGEYTAPMQDDKTAEFRGEWKIADKNNMTYSLYGKGMKDEGKEYKMMEINYKRK